MRKKNMTATSMDVARLAGTSQSTVSRVFGNPGMVSPLVRERVLSAARELSYEPPHTEQTADASGLIGVIIKDFQNPFYTNFVDQMMLKLGRAGKKIILFPGSSSNVYTVLQEAMKLRVSGLIIASSSLSEQLAAQNLPTRIPVVMINRQEASSRYCCIASDDIESSRAVADYFIHQGYQSFAFIGGSEGMQSSRHRKTGYIERLAEWGFYNVLVEAGDYTYESGYQAMRRLMGRLDGRRTAILCANDLMGLGAMDAVREVPGLRMPEDCALVGFDDIEESRWHNYGLSSMRFPISEMIDTAFEYLDTYYTEEPRCAGKHLFVCSFQHRRTT